MNVESKLRSGNAMPRRELRTDFTQTITNYIQTHPRTTWWMNPKELCMKIFDKPAMAMAGVVATLAISGTAYAAVVSWPQISAMFGGEQQTPQGRIVQVDTKNCHSEHAFTIAKPHDQRDGPRYFMVKNGSKLSNEQITQMVLGNCEQGAQTDALMQKMKQHYPSNDVIGGHVDNVITAIGPQSITLQADIPVGGNIERITKTFNKIDPAVQVYYKAGSIALDSLKVGDHVFYAYRATGDALNRPELPPTELKTDEATIVMVIKNTPAATAAIEFQKYHGSEFEEVSSATR